MASLSSSSALNNYSKPVIDLPLFSKNEVATSNENEKILQLVVRNSKRTKIYQDFPVSYKHGSWHQQELRLCADSIDLLHKKIVFTLTKKLAESLPTCFIDKTFKIITMYCGDESLKWKASLYLLWKNQHYQLSEAGELVDLFVGERSIILSSPTLYAPLIEIARSVLGRKFLIELTDELHLKRTALLIEESLEKSEASGLGGLRRIELLKTSPKIYKHLPKFLHIHLVSLCLLSKKLNLQFNEKGEWFLETLSPARALIHELGHILQNLVLSRFQLNLLLKEKTNRWTNGIEAANIIGNGDRLAEFCENAFALAWKENGRVTHKSINSKNFITLKDKLLAAMQVGADGEVEQLLTSHPDLIFSTNIKQGELNLSYKCFIFVGNGARSQIDKNFLEEIFLRKNKILEKIYHSLGARACEFQVLRMNLSAVIASKR